MPIIFSEHAKNQLKRRKIPQKQVIEAIRTFQEIEPSFRGRRLRRRQYNDKILQVITYTQGSKITVITGYYLKKK